MQAVKSKDTLPEMRVRQLLHRQGYRFRLHCSELPGCPDVVFPSRKKVVFVNGCFWHGHDCRRGSRVPKTNTDYWTRKVLRNRARDTVAHDELRNEGWQVCAIWECELTNESLLVKKLRDFLG
jgi:DNA mismatch endonuclease, patch repair protein